MLFPALPFGIVISWLVKFSESVADWRGGARKCCFWTVKRSRMSRLLVSPFSSNPNSRKYTLFRPRLMAFRKTPLDTPLLDDGMEDCRPADLTVENRGVQEESTTDFPGQGMWLHSSQNFVHIRESPGTKGSFWSHIGSVKAFPTLVVRHLRSSASASRC